MRGNLSQYNFDTKKRLNNLSHFFIHFSGNHSPFGLLSKIEISDHNLKNILISLTFFE
jgi:hypothetical protein